MSLTDAIAAARAELERLKLQETEALERSGLRDEVERLTTENQGLSERRAEARERMDELRKAITVATEHGAELELKIKGARSRVQKLQAALGLKRVIFFLGLVAFVVLAYLSWKGRSNAARAGSWTQFAAARQLGYADGRIAGVVSGFTVAMFIDARKDAEGTVDYTIVRCGLNDALPAGFKLSREGFGDKLLQLVGPPDHQLGVAELDSAFLLDGVDGDVRRVLADRTAQERLLATVARYPGMRIGNGVVQLEKSGMVGAEEDLAEMLGDAVSLATALQRARRRGV